MCEENVTCLAAIIPASLSLGSLAGHGQDPGNEATIVPVVVNRS